MGLFLKFLKQKGKPYTPIVDRVRTRAAQPTTVDALREALTESLTHWQQAIRFVDEAIGRKTSQGNGGGDDHASGKPVGKPNKSSGKGKGDSKSGFTPS